MRDQISLGARWRVPASAGPVVRRPRLETLLCGPERRPVTLLAGPPGVGKTTLLASCFGPGSVGSPDGTDQPPVAWVSLDRDDNAPGRFGALVTEALHRAGLCLTAADPGSTDTDRLDQAFEQVLERQRPGVLVLDDTHELTSPAALALLSHLVAYTPPELQVVVAARADPPVGWQRLAVSGRLRQLRWADLAFTEDETAQLLEQHGLTMDTDAVATLWGHTEGWVAGLRLAVDALQRGGDPRDLTATTTVTDEAVMAYLFAEVLSRQEPDDLDFLLATSIVSEITPPLAITLTGDATAESRLTDLFDHGLFLTAVNGDLHYRYHSLFRHLLQTHLARRSPELVRELHDRAAVWYLQTGNPLAAERHARDARDWDLVGRLLLCRWLTSLTDEPGTWSDDPLDGIPPEVRSITPELSVVALTEACRWAQREDADLHRAGVPLHRRGLADKDREQTWDTARLLSDACYGWAFGPDERSRAAVTALRHLPSTDPTAAPLRQLAILGEANDDIESGAVDTAHHRLTELVGQGKPGWPHTLASSVLAVIDACTGALDTADDHTRRVRAELDGLAGTTDASLSPAPYLLSLSTLLVTAQRGDGAAGGATPGPEEDHSFAWSSPALRAVDRVARIARRGGPPYFVSLDRATARHPLAERALLALGILEVLDPVGHLVLLGGQGERIVLDARRHLAEGALERSDPSLTAWLDEPQDHHPRTAVEAAALATIMADARRDGTAPERLRVMFDLARATGIVAPLLMYGTHLRGPIERWVDTLGPTATVALEFLDRLRPAGTADLPEPLTDREIEILRRLPLLMSNAEIAEALHLSVNTVKTHLKAVYRKLGAHNRRTAIQRARELQFL